MASGAAAQPAPDAAAVEPPSTETPAPQPAASPTGALAPSIAAAPAKPDAGDKTVAVTYDRGLSFAAGDGSFGLRLSFRNQLRFETTRPTADGGEFSSRFLIPRSRLQAEGHVFGKDNRYKLEFGLGDAGSFSFVKDLYIDKRVTGPVWFRAGQWRRPFNRQELVSDFASELNERANTATFVGGGRDLGVGVHNDYEKSPAGLEWVVGIFNRFNGGADRPSLGTSCTQNAMTGAITCVTPTPTNFPADFGPAVVVRAGWNTGGIRGYSEGDLEGGPPRLAVGVGYKIDLANFAKDEQDTFADNTSHGLQADAMFKANGFGLLLGVYMMKLKAADAQYGVLVQPGYFVLPKRAQVAARFAYAPVGARKQVEARAAFSWYWQGHTWKWSTDVGMLKLTGEDPVTMTSNKPDLQLRSMLQLTI
jgi:hypothetical protein